MPNKILLPKSTPTRVDFSLVVFPSILVVFKPHKFRVIIILLMVGYLIIYGWIVHFAVPGAS